MIISKTPPKASSASSLPLAPDLAATKIQSLFRGFQGREVFLPRSPYPDYIQACKETRTRSMKMAEEGSTPVYFPMNLPVVLKEFGKPYVTLRFNNMLMTQRVIKKERCDHLVVAKARSYKKFLIEEELPINTNPYHNITLYENNRRLFETPVREMVRLFSKLYIDDLLLFVEVDNRECLNSIRYENISFCLTTKKTKEKIQQKIEIALVDLEGVEQGRLSSNSKLKTLSTLFPFHLHVITNEADKLGMTYNRTDLHGAAISGVSCMARVKMINSKKRAFADLTQDPEL